MRKGQNRLNTVKKDLEENLYRPVFKNPWPVWVGAFTLTILNVMMFMYARAIGVFPQMAMWGSQVYNLLGVNVDAPFTAYPLTPPHLHFDSLLDFGIILGVLVAAMLSQEFKIRRESWKGYGMGIIGGVLMGFGTVITPPCNVGGFFTATMALSLSGPVMAVGLLGGAYVGGRIVKRQTMKEVSEIDFESAAEGEPTVSRIGSRQPVIGVAAALFLALITGAYFINGMPRMSVILLFGAAFGIAFQRSRICFAAAFREIFVSRDGKLMKWILLSIGLGTILFTLIKMNGYKPNHFVLPVGPHTLIGGFIFGTGMSIAGGCGVGIIWRSAEGYVRAWFAVLGGMMAAGSWVKIYGAHVGEGWLYGNPVFLPDKLGWTGSVAAILIFVAAFYVLVTWVEAGKYAEA